MILDIMWTYALQSLSLLLRRKSKKMRHAELGLSNHKMIRKILLGNYQLTE